MTTHPADPGRPARPINLNPWSVRGIIEGRKTQTRRLVKPQPPEGVGHIYVARYFPAVVDSDGYLEPGPEAFGAYDEDGEWGCRCPYGEPGDLLWGREAWYDDLERMRADEPRPTAPDEDIYYRADGEAHRQFEQLEAAFRWRPSIHMPRWASRITLRVASIRVERLQSISDADAHAEGIEVLERDPFEWPARRVFQALWDHINGKRAPWSSNPWVWVVGFQRERGEGINE